MSAIDPINKIIAPFLVHGLCRDEAEVLQMLAQDYVQRQIKRYADRVESFRAFYQTAVEQFAQQVAALCRDSEPIPALGHLDVPEQIMQAEDDLGFATCFHGLKRFSKLPRKLRRFKSLIAMPLTRTIFS